VAGPDPDLPPADRRTVDPCGLFGFAGATFIVSAHLAGWFGDTNAPEYLFPFAAAFGGIAQFAAAMWAYIARDAVATAMHGTWGAFWIGFGVALPARIHRNPDADG